MATRTLILFAILAAPAFAQDDLNDALEEAMKKSIRTVAPSVVQIATQGGLDMVATGPKGPIFRKGMGPTTGVIVSDDGYIVSSSFNFINNPTTILVTVPGQADAFIAKKIATDKSKFITLLKIDAKGLKPIVPTPASEIQEGKWTIALGRTLDQKKNAPPSVSVGVISAVGRIWGKAIQVDAKISPINYGGPIIDIQGRVQGVLVPASPRGDDETAGFEWYDSGIGFAIPMEDVLAVLPRLKKGQDLKKGLLGIRLKTGDIYGALPEIGEITRDSAAFKAGLKPGDVITAIDGKPVVRMAQIQHILGRKYEGDSITVDYKRDKEDKVAKDVVLVGNLEVYTHPFLGILPLRDDSKLGVEIRHVFEKSPAEKAKLKAGDRIVKFGVGKTMTAFDGQKPGRTQLVEFLNKHAPGDEIVLEVKQGAKTETITLALGNLVAEDSIPAKLPDQSSAKEALKPLEVANPKIKAPKIDPPAKAPELGFLKKTLPNDVKYWMYVPRTYDPEVSHGLLVWMHLPGKTKDEDHDPIIEEWVDYCRENNLILVGPLSDSESGWVPSEADNVVEVVRDAMTRYTVDKSRIVVHGMGVGGQMAIYLGLNNRDLFRGVAAVGAVPTQINENLNNQRLSFYLAAGELDPLVKNVIDGKAKLVEKKYPTTFLQMPNRGREYLEPAQIRELARWIDALDRQ